MTAADPITKASATFLNATRYGYHEGSGLQVMPGRKLSGHAWACAIGAVEAVLVFAVSR